MTDRTDDIQPQARTARVDAMDLQYLYYPGDGPAVLLLHATGFNPWLWHPISRELMTSGFRVYAPYFCDHRPSDPHQGGLSWAVLAADLAGFCGALGLQRPFMAGHSMGGAVIALANAEHPGLAAGLVLIEPIFLPEYVYGAVRKVGDHPLARKSIKRRNHWQDRAEAEQYLLSRDMFKRWNREVLELYLSHGMKEKEGGGLTLTCSPEREASQFMGSNHRNPWPLLQRVSDPVLILEGEESENHAFIDLKKAVGLFPRGRYLQVEGAGHLVPQEKPAETARILRRFFSA